MKNREAFALFKQRAGAWFAERAFVVAKLPNAGAIWGWTRPEGTKHLNVWWQGRKYQFDTFSGSKFVMEFELGRENKPGLSEFLADRFRLNHVLLDDDRRLLLELQNSVIGRLTMPTDDEYARVIGFPPFHPLIDNEFATVARPYQPNEDVWLRYHSASDVTMWADFILERMDGILDRFLTRMNEK